VRIWWRPDTFSPSLLDFPLYRVPGSFSLDSSLTCELAFLFACSPRRSETSPIERISSLENPLLPQPSLSPPNESSFLLLLVEFSFSLRIRDRGIRKPSRLRSDCFEESVFFSSLLSCHIPTLPRLFVAAIAQVLYHGTRRVRAGLRLSGIVVRRSSLSLSLCITPMAFLTEVRSPLLEFRDRHRVEYAISRTRIQYDSSAPPYLFVSADIEIRDGVLRALVGNYVCP